MSLISDFYSYVQKVGISKDDIHEEQGKGFQLVSFGEEGERDVIYNVALLLYDDNDSVEIYIRKAIHEGDELTVLRKLNAMNQEYCGVAFFKEDGLVSIKSYCKTGGNIEIAFRQLVQNMQTAKTEFPKIN